MTFNQKNPNGSSNWVGFSPNVFGWVSQPHQGKDTWIDDDEMMMEHPGCFDYISWEIDAAYVID